MSKKKPSVLSGSLLTKTKKLKQAANFTKNKTNARENIEFSDDDPFEGFSPQNDEMNFTELKRQFAVAEEYRQRFCDSLLKIKFSAKNANAQSSSDSSSEPLFARIVLGDFCQFSPNFSPPHHQCTAMAAAALAYNGIKSILDWNANDLNIILRAGQTFYEERLLDTRLNNPSNDNTFLEAIELHEKMLSIASTDLYVTVDQLRCSGGAFESREVIAATLKSFEDGGFTNGIFTYKEYSYGILCYASSNSNRPAYVFCDSHGRNASGVRVLPVTANESKSTAVTGKSAVSSQGKSAVLFFDNADKLIDFFLREWQLLPPGMPHSESRNFILVPIHFTNERLAVHASLRLADRPLIDLTESQDEIKFHVVCGDFCEYDLRRAPHSQHQCSGIVIFSFIYSTLHWITDWNVESFTDILSFGNMFYQKRYEQQVQSNSRCEATSTLHPMQLAGNCSYRNFLFTVRVNEFDFSGKMSTEDILNCFTHLKILEFSYGILIVNNLSYGITVKPVEDASVYIFFDSHGRTNTGASGGGFAAIMCFDDVNVVSRFIFNQFREFNVFHFYPVKLSRRDIPQNNTVASTEIILSNSVEPANKDHTFCLAVSISTILYAYQYGTDNWQTSTLEEIFELGEAYHDYRLKTFIAKDYLDVHSKHTDFIRDIALGDDDINLSIVNFGHGRVMELKELLSRFYNSGDQEFAILTIIGVSYAICKCAHSRQIIFHDVHGRNTDGSQGGSHSMVIFFDTLQQFYRFLMNENEELYVFSLDCVKVMCVTDTLPRVISGTFAQDDNRFCASSRNVQCTANSVVFLAFASVIQDRWRSEDVDAILMLGDHVYTVSYREVTRIIPRESKLLAAHEIRQNILVNVERFECGIVNVLCKPLTQKEYSGNFEKFAESYITRFFNNYSSGVFVCCTRSIALHKCNGMYIIFDSHARTVEGKMHFLGTANIFFFKDIDSLFVYLCRFGYNMISEFTLVPFDVSHATETDSKNRGTVHTTSFSQDSMDYIPIAESPNWLPIDNIPLNQLQNFDYSSDDEIPLIELMKKGCTQISNVISVKSLPIISKKSKAERDIDRLCSQNKCPNKKAKFELSTEEVKQLHFKWSTSNVLENFKKFQTHYEAFKAVECAEDDDLIQTANSAVDELQRVEQLQQLRRLNAALIPTHFRAYGNHEDIDETDNIYLLHKLSPFDQVCPHCGALYFKEECNSNGIFRTCCNFGDIHSQLPQQQANTYPEFLRELLMLETPIAKDFKENIMHYNNVLSFASLGTTNVHHIKGRGTIGPVVAMEGMIFHVAEHFHTNATGENMPTAQLYFLDTSGAVDGRCMRASEGTLNKGLLLKLEVFLRTHNKFAQAYRMLKDVHDEVRRRPDSGNLQVRMEIVRNRDEKKIRQNQGGYFGLPTSNEVAVLYTHDPQSVTKNVVIFPVDQPPEHGITLASHDPNRDAMMYPILFPFCEQTWTYTLIRRKRDQRHLTQSVEHTVEPNENERNEEEEDESAQEYVRKGKPRVRITVREFYCYLLMPRKTFSPILNAGKLTQQFIIDAYARAQDNAFEYLQTDSAQRQLRAETYGALLDWVHKHNLFQPDIPGKLIVMPENITGSLDYMKSRYEDALAVVAKYGKPTFFVTMTCNPMWEEIQNNIPKGSNAVDHSYMVARVFKAKVKEFLTDITKKHVLGKCEAYVGVIEWQKRTLPHLHAVIFIAPEDRPSNGVDVDNCVSAEIPDSVKTPRLFEQVRTYMYHHRCDDPNVKESCMVPKHGNFNCSRHPLNGKENTTEKCICNECSKHFPHKYANKSELVENSYPIYRRRCNGRKFLSSKFQEIDNRWIVPYNPYLLLKFNCHINIEVVSSLKTVKYLFKYLHKGVDMARVRIQIIDNVQVYNEFDHFVDCRYLSAGESIWKLLDFPMFFQSHTVYALPVHLENYQNVIFNAGNPAAALRNSDSMLIAYFNLNEPDPEARQYYYSDIPLHYVYDRKVRVWRKRVRRLDKTLGRIHMVNYNKIELHALRLLLLTVKGATSYRDIRTVNEIEYDSFRQAAVELGLLQDDRLHVKTFEEICDAEMPYRIRCLFVDMLLFNTPSDPAALWERFKSHMYEDFTRKGRTENVAVNLVLRHISNLLKASGKSNTDYLLPEPASVSVEEEHIAAIDGITDDQSDAAMEGHRLAQLLNNEQRHIYDEICDSAKNPNDSLKNKLFFVDGPGGTGKTFLFSSIIYTLNGLGIQVVPIAWTGIAASLLRGGRTVHSTFILPLNTIKPVACNLSTLSEQADKLRKATVIVWDEISMSTCYALNAVDTFFQDLMGNHHPFGGKVFVATGDFRQILPIVKGTKYDLLNVTVKKSKVWPQLQRRQLRTNVRLTDRNDIEFADWLLDVGEGKINDFPPNQYYESYVKLPSECLELKSIVDRIYGKTFSAADVDNYSKYAILSTKNEDVDFLNNEIYSRLTEDVSTEETYLSSDNVIGLHPEDDDNYDEAMLNSLNPPNLAPHKLTLKKTLHCDVAV